MPRLRRRNFKRRNQEIPLSEWTLAELEEENHRLHQILIRRDTPMADSEEEDPWYLLQRTGQLNSEIRQRKSMGSTNQMQTTVASIEEAACRE